MKIIGLLLSVGVGVFYFFSRSEPEIEREPAALPTEEREAQAPAAPTPTTVPVPAPAMEVTSRKTSPLLPLVARLEETQACYEGNCDYPRTDARSYEFAVGQALKTQLLEMVATVQSQRIVDPQVAELARLHLDNEDGHVQEAALALLATQPTSAENLEQILKKVIEGYDSELIGQAMRELERYTEAEDRFKIATALGDAMATGSPFVAKEVSTRIAPFVYPSSAPIFREVIARLPDISVVRATLEARLAGY